MSENDLKNASPVIAEKKRRLRAARKPGEKIEIMLELTRALLHPDREQAKKYSTQALRLARSSQDDSGIAKAANFLADIARLEGKVKPAMNYARQALDAARRAQDRTAEADGLNNLGLICWHKGDFDAAIAFFNQSLALCAPDGSEPPVKASSALRPSPSTKNQELRTKNQELRTRNVEQLRSRAYANLSLVNWEKGDLLAAMDYQQRSLDLRQRLGDGYGIGLCQLNVGLIYGDMGDWDKAIECYYRALVEFEKHGDKTDMALCYNNLGEVYLRRNKPDKARELFESAIRYAELGASNWVKAEALGNLGELHFRQGDMLRARDCYEQDQKLSTAMDDKEELAETYRRIGELLLATGDYEQARRTLAAALKLTGSTGAKKEAGNIWRVLGNLHVAAGDHAQAKSAFEQGLAILKKFSSSYELGRCLLDFGRALIAADEAEPPGTRNQEPGTKNQEALGHLRQAEELFRRLGAPAELDAARSCHSERSEESHLSEKLLELAARSDTPAELGTGVLKLLRDSFGEERVTPYRRDRVSPSEQQEVGNLKPEADIIGAQSSLAEIMALIRQVAPTKAGVLVQGESGTGKELIARTIHNQSDRAGRAFVAINCAAIPETLLESELFGIEKGTATGVSERKGKFEQAAGGTIFLDEVGDMSLVLQAKLLRVLQEREFERVGGRKTILVDIRVIAATNRDLSEAIAEGKFREDLYWRLNVVPIVLPPLRERRPDIPLLARHFADRYTREYRRKSKTISSEALAALLHHSWPGNVRELENAIERAVILSRGELITPADLPANVAPPVPRRQDYRTAKVQARADASVVEKEFLLRTLNECGWNITRTAQSMTVTRRHLYRLLDKYHIERKNG